MSSGKHNSHISLHANGLLECTAELFVFVLVPISVGICRRDGPRYLHDQRAAGERVGMLDVVQVQGATPLMVFFLCAPVR